MLIMAFLSISSDEFTPVEEDEKNSSSESSSEGRNCLTGNEMISDTIPIKSICPLGCFTLLQINDEQQNLPLLIGMNIYTITYFMLNVFIIFVEIRVI